MYLLKRFFVLQGDKRRPIHISSKVRLTTSSKVIIVRSTVLVCTNNCAIMKKQDYAIVHKYWENDENVNYGGIK